MCEEYRAFLSEESDVTTVRSILQVRRTSIKEGVGG